MNYKNIELTYRDWLQLKDERVAECFRGVKIEPTVAHVVILSAEKLAELAWEFDVTTQSVVDNFSRELLKGNRPELSLSVIREYLKTYRG